MKLKLVKPSSVDLNDPAIEEELLNKVRSVKIPSKESLVACKMQTLI